MSPERPDAPHAFLFEIAAEDEDVASALLWEAKTTGFVVGPVVQDRLELLAYFPAAANPAAAADALAEIGTRGRAVPVPDVDWVARFREGFRGFRVGGFFVEPAWTNAVPRPRTLIVDPGRAFGTGTHETTRLCLRALEQIAKRQPLGRVLDLGAGTGLLTLAALRLGAEAAAASEIDAEAIAEAVRHAAINELRPWIVQADGGSAYRSNSFDVVLANIAAPLLIERADEIARLLRPRGRLLLAGLLDVDLTQVRDAYAHTPLVETTRELDGEWALLQFGAPS